MIDRRSQGKNKDLIHQFTRAALHSELVGRFICAKKLDVGADELPKFVGLMTGVEGGTYNQLVYKGEPTYASRNGASRALLRKLRKENGGHPAPDAKGMVKKVQTADKSLGALRGLLGLFADRSEREVVVLMEDVALVGLQHALPQHVTGSVFEIESQEGYVVLRCKPVVEVR
jgi:hypothetical protein